MTVLPCPAAHTVMVMGAGALLACSSDALQCGSKFTEEQIAYLLRQSGLVERIDRGRPVRKTIPVRTSAVIGLVLGALSVVAGGRVLADIDRPDYAVLHWLVIYNVAAGFVGVVAGAGLWRLRWWGVELARTLAGFHGAVLVVLIAWFVTGRPVAIDSLLAMLLRTLVWASIAVVTRRTLRSGSE
jgi:hypothetical protein